MRLQSTAKKPNKQFETQREQKGTHLSNYNLVGKGQEKDLSEINLEGQGKVAPLCSTSVDEGEKSSFLFSFPINCEADEKVNEGFPIYTI